jgi:hypothetical protein
VCLFTVTILEHISHQESGSALVRKKESRKRNLNFHIPAAISFSPNLRLLQNDSSYVTLGDIYDRHCEENGITREDPILVSGEKVKSVLLDFKQANQRAVRYPHTRLFCLPHTPLAWQGGIFYTPQRYHGRSGHETRTGRCACQGRLSACYMSGIV